ncbi:MAG: energy transducer TonB [Flavobacteriales bacterium]|nr:energy transducer TonB [Flavobacteriales bacterium]
MKTSILILLTLSFALSARCQDTKKAVDPDQKYTVVEVMPVYPGGDMALVNWVGRTVTYPPKAKKRHITGKVFVSYIVERNGRVSNVKTVKRVHPLLDKAAIKCIKKLKGYKAGLQDGEPVRVQFTIPINFVLN